MGTDEGCWGAVTATACFPRRVPKLVVRYAWLESEPLIPALVRDDSSVEGIAKHVPHTIPSEQRWSRDTASGILADVTCSEALPIQPVRHHLVRMTSGSVHGIGIPYGDGLSLVNNRPAILATHVAER